MLISWAASDYCFTDDFIGAIKWNCPRYVLTLLSSRDPNASCPVEILWATACKVVASGSVQEFISWEGNEASKWSLLCAQSLYTSATAKGKKTLCASGSNVFSCYALYL